jgi:hypothetical protein
LETPVIARALIVHNLAHARAALSAACTLGVPVVLISAAGAAAYAGARYFLEFTGRAMAEYPEARARTVLDCGPEPGLALGALGAGCPAIRYTGPRASRVKIADIAARSGARVDNSRYRALDLCDVEDARTACLEWLAERR